ncbi:MAG: DUF5681 domain-containing protein [Phycisphaerae bacterium]|nr:DUF5681 domain-containing protein [Phycisphaerae bacterium]
MTKQAVNTPTRRQDGTFAPGNKIGPRFKPGQSGNPKGRPPERPLTALLRETLDANDGELIRSIVLVAVERAVAGDFRYFKEIMDRTDGKVSERLNVTANDMDAEDYPGLSAEQLALIAETEGGPTD